MAGPVAQARLPLLLQQSRLNAGLPNSSERSQNAKALRSLVTAGLLAPHSPERLFHGRWIKQLA